MIWIQTFSGKRFNLRDPQPDQICIEDIAHSLALQCRFTGHPRKFYSVAQHSVTLSHHVPRRVAFDALLHDAHEAYSSDLASPAKLLLDDYVSFERRIEVAVRRRFGLPDVMSPTVRVYDKRLCHTEMLALFDDELDWSFVFEPLDVPIVPWPCRVAEVRFMSRFEELVNERAIQK
jgi:hypothetical protein